MPVDDAGRPRFRIGSGTLTELDRVAASFSNQLLGRVRSGIHRIVVRRVYDDRRPDGHGPTAIVDRPGHRVVDRGCPAFVLYQAARAVRCGG